MLMNLKTPPVRRWGRATKAATKTSQASSHWTLYFPTTLHSYINPLNLFRCISKTDLKSTERNLRRTYSIQELYNVVDFVNRESESSANEEEVLQSEFRGKDSWKLQPTPRRKLKVPAHQDRPVFLPQLAGAWSSKFISRIYNRILPNSCVWN